jgi:hypothetical protein
MQFVDFLVLIINHEYVIHITGDCFHARHKVILSTSVNYITTENSCDPLQPIVVFHCMMYIHSINHSIFFLINIARDVFLILYFYE